MLVLCVPALAAGVTEDGAPPDWTEAEEREAANQEAREILGDTDSSEEPAPPEDAMTAAEETKSLEALRAAQVLTIGDTVNGAIENEGNTCTYEFTLSASGRVALTATSYMQYYTLELYDADGTRIWYRDRMEYDSGSGMRTDRHEIDLEAGIYYLRVGGSYYAGGSTTSTGNYTIKLGGVANAHIPPGYQVDRVVIRDSGGEVLGAIPTGKFLASVSMTNVAPGKETMVLLSAYSARGEYMGLMYARAKGLRQNGTLKVTLPVDNTSGNITQLKAFAILSFNDLRPLGSVVSFPV